MMVMSEERAVVKVSATVKDNIEPDLAVFTIRFGRMRKTQRECADDFAIEKKRVAHVLEPFGLADKLGFSNYSSYACTTGRRAIITGYEYYCSATLKTEREQYDVAAIWMALAGTVSTARVNIRFEIADVDAAEDRLIGKAVAKATRSADALAAASGMQLGNVREIRYRRCGDSHAPDVMFSARRIGHDDSDEDFMPELQPKPIEVECSVDVDWWLTPAK